MRGGWWREAIFNIRHGKQVFPHLPHRWQQFFLSILLHMMLPLLPLGMEWWYNREVSVASMTLAAAMYTISMGISSRNQLLRWMAIIAALCFSFAFGATVGDPLPLETAGVSLERSDTVIQESTHSPPNAKPLAMIGITAVFLLHAAERYQRHVVECTPFFIKEVEK